MRAGAQYAYTWLLAPGALITMPCGLSGSNIVGYYVNPGYYAHGFLYDGSNYTTLNVPAATGTWAYGISGTNIVGYYQDSKGVDHGFLYNGNGTNYTVIDVPEALYTESFGISEANIVGTYVDTNHVTHGFLFDGSAFTNVDVPGGLDTFAQGIDGTNIVGYYEGTNYGYHGFLFDGSNYQTLDVPGALETEAFGISGNEIVGYYQDATFNYHGFLFEGGVYTTLDVTGEYNTKALGISDGTIVGNFSVLFGFVAYPTSTIVGHIYCVCGSNALAGASINIGGSLATSDSNGNYIVTNLPSGTYPAIISANNYETLITNLTIDAGGIEVTNDFYLTNATLVIAATFDTNILGDVNAPTITNSIETVIRSMEQYIASPVCVTIHFAETNEGVAENSILTNSLSYAQYLADLLNNQALSAYDKSALATLPAGSNNPVNSGTKIIATTPLLRTIGEAALGEAEATPDGVVFLNTGIMNLSRSGPQDTNFYDLQGVVTHQIDEVLGIGGAGSQLNNVLAGVVSSNGPIGPMDLFRYDGPSLRSYNTNADDAPYFSIDGGSTTNVHFNQFPSADFGDWGNGVIPAQQEGNFPPQVQDAFGTPATNVDSGRNELIALDVAGYTLFSVPPAVQNITFGDGALTFTWNAIPGQFYQPQFTTNLTVGAWSNLGGPVTAYGLTASTSDTNASGTERFYRVETVSFAPLPAQLRIPPKSIKEHSARAATGRSHHYLRPSNY